MLRNLGKSWWAAFALIVLCALPFYNELRVTRGQLNDSDTVLILNGIRARHDPLSWFKGDWPLANHFYRPIVSEIFEFDEATHPGSTVGFAWTDITLCFLSTLGLFWFLRELLDSKGLAIGGTLIFILWQWDMGGMFLAPCHWIGIACLIAGFIRHGFKFGLYLPAFLVWFWLGIEVAGITSLNWRMLTWIPGRTASTMTVFAFIAMAAFARYLRLSPLRSSELPPATALDKPATKSTVAITTGPAPSIGWPILSCAALLIGLGAYEQAVMIPALLGLIALYFWLQGRKVQWAWGLAFGVCLGSYLILRQTVISHEASAYWNWQKRTTNTALTMMQRYLFIPYRGLSTVWLYLSDSPYVWLNPWPWIGVMESAGALSALWESRRRWLLCGFGWLGSTLAYGPMAWFKDFDHYHYWPMAVRSIFILGLGWVAIDLAVIALSRPSVRAPRRLSPAPGSLLHL